MSNKPISMSKIRQIIQLYTQGRSKLCISEQTGIARNTLKKYLNIFQQNSLSLAQIQELSDKELEDLFIISNEKIIPDKHQQLFSLFPQFDKELRKKGVTKALLWGKYKNQFPDGLGRSQFNRYFYLWKKQVNPTMRMEHKVGDKMYVDFAGDKLHITDPLTGLVKDVEVFVAILGASQLTYVEAVFSQQKEDFIGACENALHYYGGVPAAIVPDNLKSAVTKSSKYEPIINESFADFARHYNTTVLPARAYRPRDKALVENAVRIIYTRIYAKLNNTIFFSLDELNEAIKIALEQHNSLLLTGRNYSRRNQFEEIERSALLTLPLLRYEFKQTSYITVMMNGHVSLSIDKHYYSVPYRFIGKKVKLLYSRRTVEVYYNYERIAIHNRIKSPYQYTTEISHLASAHRFVSEWNPERFLNWSKKIHPDVQLYISNVLEQKQHPEQCYKSCMGILSFEKKVGKDRLISACQRALGYELYNYKTIQNILERGLENDKIQDESLDMPAHDNIRGEDYYQ